MLLLRLLQRIFEIKREELAGSWRRQHNKELHNLYTSPNIRVIKLIKDGQGMQHVWDS
jgi:hypothetical protein